MVRGMWKMNGKNIFFMYGLKISRENILVIPLLIELRSQK